MENWDDLRFLVAVAKSGSMTGAARLLGTNVATVSRRIDRLTQSLGAAPFVRTPEGWRPSAQMAGLIEIAAAFEGRLATEVNSARPAGTFRPRVTVRVGAPPFVSHKVLLPTLADSSDVLSAVALEVGDRITGDGLGEFDVVVRFGAPEAGRLRTRRVGSLAYRLFGRRDGGNGPAWAGLWEIHEGSGPMRMARVRFAQGPDIRVATFEALAEVILSTGLPGPLPDVVARGRPDLVALDGPDAPVPWIGDFWVAYHESRRGDPAIEATVDWIGAAFDRVAP